MPKSVLPLTTGKPARRSAGRLLAQALRGRRTGARVPLQGGGEDAPGEAISAGDAPPKPPATADDAAARIDAARERLRARIPAPREDPG